MRSLAARTARRPGFWMIIIVLGLLCVPHYGEVLEHPTFVTNITEGLGLDRHALERILFLAPIIWAGFLFGYRGAVVTSVVALACMLPRAIGVSEHPGDAIFETVAVFMVGNMVALTFHSLHREREHRVQLGVLNEIARVTSESLELSEVLARGVKGVMEGMEVDGCLVYLVDGSGRRLELVAHGGVSERFVDGVRGMEVGEGFNGRVAAEGEALYVRDVARDGVGEIGLVIEEGIVSQMIVPLEAKGTVVGTLCVAERSGREYSREEKDLLRGIGRQIGVAVENARLYEQEKEIGERLRVSEERYRELFENAHEAIWVEDVGGKVKAVNRSFEELTGYRREELEAMEARELIEGMDGAGGEGAVGLEEVRLKKRDGSVAVLQLSRSAIVERGKVVGYQQIGRDVTEERRMKENLRYYLHEVTRAQEEERKRIARELHDDTVQSLVVLARQLDDIGSRARGLTEGERSELEKLRQQTNGVMEGLRRLSQDLRPATLDRLGLIAGLEWLGENVAGHSGIKVEVKARGEERRMGPEAELVLFRIVQEALRNVWRHSGASRAEVGVEFGAGTVRVYVRDDGKGFEVRREMGASAKDGKLGLAGMEERARLLGGRLDVDSKPGKGTTITVDVPV